MKYKALAELEVALGPVEPTHREEYKLFEGLANAVNHAIVDEIPYHEALEGVAVVKVRIPAVPAVPAVPAAAGEDLESEEAYIPLNGEQIAQAQRILRLATASPILKAVQLAICPQTGAVVGWVRTASRSQLFSHVVSENSVRLILG